MGDILAHEVMHAAGVVASYTTSPKPPSEVSDTEQSGLQRFAVTGAVFT